MSNATCLLALPEFEATAVWELIDEAIVHIVMPRREVACTRCGVIAIHRVHDRVVQRVRDLPAGGRAVVLLWAKRVLACVEGCGTFRERSRSVPPRACLTARARAEAVRLVSGENRSVVSLAATFGVSWDTVMRAVRDDADRVLADHDGQRVIAFGLDETVMNPSRSQTRRRYVTVFVDLDRHRVIDVVEGRHADAVTGWLKTQDASWRAQVATVALDPHAGYRTAVTDDKVGFGNARLVADWFHVVKLAHAATGCCASTSPRAPTSASTLPSTWPTWSTNSPVGLGWSFMTAHRDLFTALLASPSDPVLRRRLEPSRPRSSQYSPTADSRAPQQHQPIKSCTSAGPHEWRIAITRPFA